MVNTTCCENNPCNNTDLFDMNMRLYNRQNRIHRDNQKLDNNLLKKKWFVLSEKDFRVVYDEDVAKAIVYG